MKVKNARAAELSDFEVLSVLRDLETKQREAVASASLADAVAHAAAHGGGGTELSLEEKAMRSLPPNLRTIQYEVLETLGNVQRPCAHQTGQQIPRFLDALTAWEKARPVEGVAGLSDEGLLAPIEKEKRLTKGERLLLVNHAPTSEIELYSLVEEIEERFTMDQIQDLLAIVGAHLPIDQSAIQTSTQLDEGANTKATQMLHALESDKTLIEEEDEGLADPDEDMDMLENEARGEGAVDDEGPEEE